MADNVQAELVLVPGVTFASDDDGTAQHPYTKLEWGPDNTFTKVDAGASALPVQDGGNSITVDDGGGSVTVDGAVAISGTVPVSGPLTDAQLRASTVPVTDANLDVALSTRLKPADTLSKVATVDTITNIVHVDDNAGSLTVDGTVAVSGVSGVVHVDDNAGSLTVDGTVTANAGTNLNTSALALEGGGNLALIKAKTDNLDVALSTRLKPADTLTAVTTVGTITNAVHVDDNAGSLTVDGTVSITGTVPLPTNAAQETGGNLASIYADLGNLDSRPSAYSMLDRLYQLGAKLDAMTKVQATEATLRQLLPKPPVLSRGTLLHRSI